MVCPHLILSLGGGPLVLGIRHLTGRLPAVQLATQVARQVHGDQNLYGNRARKHWQGNAKRSASLRWFN